MKYLLIALIVCSCVAPRVIQVREEVMTLKRIEKVKRDGYERKAYVWTDEKGIEYFDEMPLYEHSVGDRIVRLITR